MMFEPRITGEDATKKCIFVVEVIELEQQLCGMFTINANLNFPAEKNFSFSFIIQKTVTDLDL